LINALLLLLASTTARSSSPAAPLELSVLVAPAPIDVGGTTHLVYELHLASGAANVWLHRIEVLAGRQPQRGIAHYSGAELASMMGTTSSERPTRIARNQRTVVYFWIPLAGAAEVPDSLHHRITVAADGDSTRTSVVEGGATPVRRRVPGLGPPLEGGPWVAVYDPGLQRGHRRVLFHNEPGVGHIPARFAIDWLRIDREGRLARADRTIVSNHYGYGAAVLAVADARVAAARDGVAERKTLVHVAHGPDLASGNYITLDLGDGQYVSYEHLMTGSVRVAVGDAVRRGQVIARLGFSGDGASPHLHMHVSDGATPLRGEGVPWALEQFELLGVYPDLAAVFAARPWLPADSSQAGVRRQQLPSPNVVVRFPTAVSAHLGKIAAIANVTPLASAAAPDVDEQPATSFATTLADPRRQVGLQQQSKRRAQRWP
jgi:murein DD-endopeptidase